MKVVIYVEKDVYPLDFAIPYEMFSQAGAEVQLVAADPGQLATATGLTIAVKNGLTTAKDVDLLWVCGSVSSDKIDSSTLTWLNTVAQSAKLTVAICSGVRHLIEAGALRNKTVSLNKEAQKKYKILQLTPLYQSLVRDDNLITANSHGAVFRATLLAIEALFGSAVLADIKSRYAIVDFIEQTNDERIFRKLSKQDDKYNARYLKEIKKVSDDKNCVLYAYAGMSAVDYLVADAFASQMGYKIERIADQRGTVETLRGGYEIVVNAAIQNHRQAKLLFVPGGQIEAHLVNQFLMHWFVGICTASYRVMTVGSAEQLLGVTGLLKEIDPDVLANLALGEGKYMMVAHFVEIARALLNIASAENEKRALLTARHFGFSVDYN